MMAHEILQKAADLIEAQGWSAGGPARDQTGRAVSLYVGTRANDARAGVNPSAYRFSAYGAIAKVLASRGGLNMPPSAWSALNQLAMREHGVRGGPVHPLVAFNEAEGRTKDEVVAFLRKAADQLDPAKLALEAGRAE